jgi:alanyl-tRNA synthetase
MMLVTARVDLDARAAKDLAFMMKQGHPRLFLLLVTVEGGKVGLTLLAGEELVGSGKVHAGEIIKVLAREIRGGGGGQPHFATAGGTDPAGIPALFKKTEEMLSSL